MEAIAIDTSHLERSKISKTEKNGSGLNRLNRIKEMTLGIEAMYTSKGRELTLEQLQKKVEVAIAVWADIPAAHIQECCRRASRLLCDFVPGFDKVLEEWKCIARDLKRKREALEHKTKMNNTPIESKWEKLGDEQEQMLKMYMPQKYEDYMNEVHELQRQGR